MLVLQHCRCRISESHHLQVSAELQGVCVHHGDCPLINQQTVMQKFLTWEAWWKVAVDVYIRHSPLSWTTIDQAIRALVCLTHGRRSRFAKLWTFISCNYRNVLLMSKILQFIVKGNHTNSAPRAWIGCLGLRASHSFDQTKHFCGRYKFYDVVLFGALTTTTKPSQKKNHTFLTSWFVRGHKIQLLVVVWTSIPQLRIELRPQAEVFYDFQTTPLVVSFTVDGANLHPKIRVIFQAEWHSNNSGIRSSAGAYSVSLRLL